MSRWMRPDRRALLQRVHTLSAMRMSRHGGPPADPAVWWQQIVDIARETGIEMPTEQQWRDSNKPDQWEMPL